jgi:hypothetical protein
MEVCCKIYRHQLAPASPVERVAVTKHGRVQGETGAGGLYRSVKAPTGRGMPSGFLPRAWSKDGSSHVVASEQLPASRTATLQSAN